MAIAHPAPRPSPHSRPLPLRVGTRGSPLALWQTRFFLKRLSGFCPVLRDMDVFEEHPIRTTGDATQAAGTRLADLGGKGLFTKEIHEALLDRRIDFAVHSLKDLETELPSGIVLACTLVREDARDALILPIPERGPEQGPVTAGGLPLDCLPQGALIGTSSLRRQAQLAHLRPDLRFDTIRGNLDGRIARIRRGDFGATLLALAGMKRLGLEHEVGRVLEPDVMLPAACQGIVGITVRADDVELRAMLAAIEDADASVVSSAERALLAALDGSCRTPIGGHATIEAEGQLRLTGLVARADGSYLLRRTIAGPRADAARLGAELGASLRRTRRGTFLADWAHGRGGVLITRPEAGAKETARLVAALGFTPIAAPMLVIAPLPVRLPPPGRLQAVLLTSATAVAALGPEWHALPLLAVGDATAARARAAGFADVTSAGGTAEDLAALVARRCAPARGPLLLPTARGEGQLLTRMLRAAGFAVQRRTVYVAMPQNTLAPATIAALSGGAVAAALFFSPATARHFAALLPAVLPATCLDAIDALALSPAVAAPLAALPWRRIRVAPRPTQDALLTLLADPNDA